MSVIDVAFTKEGFKDKILPTFGQKKKSDFSIYLHSFMLKDNKIL